MGYGGYELFSVVLSYVHIFVQKIFGIFSFKMMQMIIFWLKLEKTILPKITFLTEGGTYPQLTTQPNCSN